MSDRIVVMNDGAIEQVGSPSEIYNAPRTRFVASFVGTLNLIHGRIVDASSGAVDIDGQRATTRRKLNGAKPGDILPMALRPEALRNGEGGDDRNTLAGVIEESPSSARSSGPGAAGGGRRHHRYFQHRRHRPTGARRADYGQFRPRRPDPAVRPLTLERARSDGDGEAVGARRVPLLAPPAVARAGDQFARLELG